MVSPNILHLTSSKKYSSTSLPCQHFTDPEAAWFEVDRLHQHNTPYNLIYSQNCLHLIPRVPQDSRKLSAQCSGYGWSEMAGVVTLFSRDTFEGLSVEAFEAELAEIYGQGDGSAAEVVADAGQDLDLRDLMQDLPAIEDLLEAQDDAPVIRMVNALLMQAVRERASDIHIEPFAQRSVVRLRRDGLLADIAEPPRGVHEAMVSRILPRRRRGRVRSSGVPGSPCRQILQDLGRSSRSG